MHRFRKTAKLLWRKRLLIAVDAVLFAAAFAISYLLRFEFAIPPREMAVLRFQLPVVVAIQTIALMLSGAQAFIWRYIGLAELGAFVRALGIAGTPLLIGRLAASDNHFMLRVPFSVIAIDSVFAFAAIVGTRVLRRIVYERFERSGRHFAGKRNVQRVLLIGAGRFGRNLVSEVQQDRRSSLIIKGFVDDAPEKQNASIRGIKVLGTTEDLAWLVKEFDIDHVIITLVQASRQQLRRILQLCDMVPVKVRIIPSLWELIHDRVGISGIRDFEISDLLGREPVTLIGKHVQAALAGKVVVVTGAGGSIGSELARQVDTCNPGLLLLVDRAEPALFNIQQELRRHSPNLRTMALLADITDRARLEGIFEKYRPQVILHAAAHKHVPILETNVADGVTNNVIGTHVLGELAGSFGAEVMVLISTDKAVRPKSILGATKRVAELIVQELDQRFDCKYLAVRFGNVIGSTGSVIPVFRDQIRNGGPVTVTHPEMTRYFMTIPEAAQLVLEAMTMGHGSEIFTLDMGEPVKILSLARDLISLCGLRPYEDIDIVFTGTRPGEKINEELDLDKSSLSPTRHPKIYIGKMEAQESRALIAGIGELKNFAHLNNSAAVRLCLNRLVPEGNVALHVPADTVLDAAERPNTKAFSQTA